MSCVVVACNSILLATLLLLTWSSERLMLCSPCALQTNGVDCGVFVIAFASFLARNGDLRRVTQEEMENARLKIASQCLEAKL